MANTSGKKARKVHGTRAAAKRSQPRTSKYAEKKARRHAPKAGAK